ncbi:NACHT, LRR and PYD domains-containing protein 3-like, partial [Hyalella azteca]|uniref:NACHT, LRR and PYD domains-containing protein 3-like n=1 Tax=Hyalella azteca TaxID=294128 RepID=A0A8B7NWQ0_HYAAZ
VNGKMAASGGFSPGGRDLAYYCYWVTTKGRRIANQRFQEYAKEDLLFDAGCVERLAVFHQLEVTSEEEKKNKLTLEQLFHSLKKGIAVISGVVGAGKTTLLMYLMLQFSGPQSAVPKHLQSFEIVVFIQCRDRDNKNLEEVVKVHFGVLSADMTAEDILLTLQQLRVLFLVDGFDERNEVSSAVLRELLDKTWHQDSRILITTCPRAAEDLKNLLRNKGKVSEEYKILQISELRRQLDFIEKYGIHLTMNGDAALAMRERFSKLNPQVQSLFTKPILLLYFCSIFKETPEKIDQWRSLNDMSMDRFELQKIVMKTKLSDIGVRDPDLLIDKLLGVIGKCALEFLAFDHVTFTSLEISIMKEQCGDKIRAHTSIVEVGTEVFLNTMLVVKKPLSGGKDTTYSFPHKSVQETVAANYVVRQMMLTEDTLQEILGVEPTKNKRLREVLLYVVAALSRDSPRHLTRRWGELKETLREAGVTARDVMDCVARCRPDHAGTVAELAALTEGKKWNVRNGRHVAVVPVLLRHGRPSRVVVHMKAAVLRGAPWGALVAVFKNLQVHLGPFVVAADVEAPTSPPKSAVNLLPQ